MPNRRVPDEFRVFLHPLVPLQPAYLANISTKALASLYADYQSHVALGDDYYYGGDLQISMSRIRAEVRRRGDDQWAIAFGAEPNPIVIAQPEQRIVVQQQEPPQVIVQQQQQPQVIVQQQRQQIIHVPQSPQVIHVPAAQPRIVYQSAPRVQVQVVSSTGQIEYSQSSGYEGAGAEVDSDDEHDEYMAYVRGQMRGERGGCGGYMSGGRDGRRGRRDDGDWDTPDWDGVRGYE
ncbi:hypothetical protein P153DRAFT_360265 [Dothidotthia symphoricarpi CBS 119687]|uniref:Uncharacterized protein n=1 Tax=Dothidotthia symphoricarpi CBS 119687 TaxID=1392245 RepID=A0A6A5ZZT4_9PLEO|nr:uncharacterized protein P153DRAFT_360265 [Dothidotthia symphoricarpi CBS 119687]KAF2125262.1 hypothetical protein P153DRAFT_360265 [Dothidotthia symphoricarpi CBS 119687]